MPAGTDGTEGAAVFTAETSACFSRSGGSCAKICLAESTSPKASRQCSKPAVAGAWLLYFAVPDCAAAIDTAKSLGGRLLHGPITMETVRSFAVLADPQGAVFAIVETKKPS